MITVLPTVPVSETLSAYCFGRVLAERFGLCFSFPGIRGLVRDSEVAGRRGMGSGKVWRGNWPFESPTGRRVEVAEFHASPGKGLRLDGAGFQRWEFLADVRDRVLGEWVVPTQVIPARGMEEFAICLSASKEREDVGRVKLPDDKPVASGCIGEGEIRRLTRVARGAKFVLITGEVEHPVLKAVADLKLPVLLASDWEQFLWIRSFSRVAISQNAAQWWGAFTGLAREIYFPRTTRGPWSVPAAPVLAHEPWWHGIELRVPGDGRFVYGW